jgi:hypothetical protein
MQGKQIVDLTAPTSAGRAGEIDNPHAIVASVAPPNRISLSR